MSSRIDLDPTWSMQTNDCKSLISDVWIESQRKTVESNYDAQI